MTKAQSKKKATKKVTYSVLDNFDDYRQWIREATTHDTEIQMSQIHRDWDTLTPEHRSAFADAVRAFREANATQVAVYADLENAASKASALGASTLEERPKRKFGRDAGACALALAEIIKTCHSANYDLLLELDDLDAALATRPKAELHSTLHKHQQRLRNSVERGDAKITSWTKDCDLFKHSADWTDPETVEAFLIFARLILGDLLQIKSAPEPANEGGPSSPKRKRQNENEEPSPKVLRRPGDTNVPHGDSVQAGAENSRQQSHGAFGNAGNQKATTGDEQVERDVDAPGQALSVEGTGKGLAAPELPEEPAATPEPLPFPETGVPGPWTSALRDNLDRVSPSFKSWCRSQLTDANHRSLEDVEPLATALVHFWNETASHHDWENEGGVPHLPLTLADFSRPWPGGRLWPNVRRLNGMLGRSSADFRSFYDRNLTIEEVYKANANTIARDIIRQIHHGGLTQGWDRVDDLDRAIPPPEHTDQIPLDGLNRESGHWNVSIGVGMILN